MELGLGWVPILFFVVTVTGYIIPYFIATSQQHVYFLLPAISDSGVRSPESFVFRELLNLSGFLSICNVYIRYKQYEMFSTFDAFKLGWLRKLNLLCMLDGLVGGVAVTFVANFKSKRPTPFGFATQHSIHNGAAAMVFITGLIYCTIQTYMSFWVVNLNINTVKRCYVRLGLTCSVIVNFVVFVCCSVIAHRLYASGDMHSSKDALNKLFWMPTDPGYIEHVVANFAEWFMCMSFLSFSLTFFNEFQRIQITSDFREEHEKEAILTSLNSLRSELAALELNKLNSVSSHGNSQLDDNVLPDAINEEDGDEIEKLKSV